MTERDIPFSLRGEHIALDSLLKACGLAESGGRAKALVAMGMVRVDGEPESRKTAKIRAGQVVEVEGRPDTEVQGRIRIQVHGEGTPGGEAPPSP
jgi:ribosome-associated protein